MQLCVLHAGEVVHSQPLGAAPLHLGRAPTNDLVLPRTDVSGHHAMIYRDADQVWLRDLGSSNGTFVNGERVMTPVALRAGDRIRLGAAAELLITEAAELPRAPLRLEREDGTVGWSVSSAVFPLPGVPADVVLLVAEDDEVWLAVDGMETERVRLGHPFAVAGERFVLREVTGPTPDTVRPTAARPLYELHVSLSANEARLVDRAGGSCEVTTEHRVAMLYALAKRWLEEGGHPSRGWIDDDALGLAVWGRQSREQGANNLHVLVHRVRKEVKKAGFDPWFLEKRAGRTRVRVASVHLS